MSKPLISHSLISTAAVKRTGCVSDLQTGSVSSPQPPRLGPDQYCSYSRSSILAHHRSLVPDRLSYNRYFCNTTLHRNQSREPSRCRSSLVLNLVLVSSRNTSSDLCACTDSCANGRKIASWSPERHVIARSGLMANRCTATLIANLDDVDVSRPIGYCSSSQTTPQRVIVRLHNKRYRKESTL